MISKQSYENFLANVFVWTSLHSNRIKRIFSLLLYSAFLVNMGTFCYLKANSDRPNLTLPSVLPGTIFIITVIAGIQQVLLILSGLHAIVFLRLTTSLVLDLIVWASAMEIAWIVSGYDDFDTIETAMVAVNALLLGLLLNTGARFDKVFNEKIDPGEHHKHMHISCSRIGQVIEGRKISSENKNNLLYCLDYCGRNENDELNTTQFLRFLHRAAPIILRGKFTSTQKQEFNLLQNQLQINFLCHDPNDTANEEFDDSVEEVISVVTSASKLLGQSQMKLVIIFIIDLLITCCMKSSFDLVAGIGVNAAQNVAQEQEGSKQELQIILLALGVIYLVNEITYYLLSYLASRLIANGTARIQRDLVDAVLYSGNIFEKKYRQGTLSNLFNAGIAKLELVWDHILFDFALSLSTLISALIFMALIDVGYAIFVLAAITFLASLRNIEKMAVDASSRSDTANAKLFSRFQNILHIRKAAKVSNSQAFVAEKIQKNALKAAKSANFSTWLWSNLVVSVYSTVVYSLILVTTILFLIALSKGEISAGEFFSLVVFIQGTTQPIEDFGRFYGEIAHLSGTVHKFQKVLDNATTDDQHPDADSNIVEVPLVDKLILDKVNFSYSMHGPDVIKEVSAVIPSGSFVAVVGSSGSGKSTLLSLLMGANCPSDGEIYFDDIPLSRIPLSSLRDSISVVFQDIFVFDGTIRENIAFGFNATIKDIEEAAKDAGIHDFIKTLPDQYETILGKESTIGLSGGQLQRICGIARALVRKPKLLILDEATSSLDNVTAGYVIETIEKLCEDRGMTIISVTHNVSMAINADLILVIDEGSVVEKGRYSELITKGKNSNFWRLANARQSVNVISSDTKEESSTCSDDSFLFE